MLAKIKPEWITAIGTVILIALTIVLILQGPALAWLRWPWFILPVAVVGGMVLAAVLNFKSAKLHTTATAQQVSPPPSVTTKDQGRQLAMKRISELLTRGDYLIGQTPSSGATASDYCRFWGEQMQQWSQEVGTLLSDNWGQEAMNSLFSTRGVQWDQPVPRIHTEAVSNYHQLNRWLQNLEHLKQTLPK